MGVKKTSFHPHNGLGMRLEILHVYIYSSYITLIGVDDRDVWWNVYTKIKVTFVGCCLAT